MSKPKVAISIRFDPDDFRRVRNLAAARSTSVNSVVVRAVRLELKLSEAANAK